MFEVITMSQPMDYQSLEILKEAYSKLGRNSDVIGTSKRIAEAYVNLGQLSSAILEYESILHRCPDDPDVRKALGEIESKANSLSEPLPVPETDFVEKATASAALKKAVDSPGSTAPPVEIDDGKHQMHKIFVEGKLVSQNDFDTYWPRPSLNGRQGSEPFIHVLAERQILPLERSMRVLCEKARIAYLPLDKYDVDVEFARNFPKDVCLRWSILPFDRMSKSILIATANPFNKQAVREIEAHNRSRIIWYLAPPGDLQRVLKKIFR